ncbi:MAG: 23S rRNA pseudouridine(2604) synthase [Candidatus Anoxychlamydiales bacterium]|nr:23S rRNA pseudouridine(2604) synthase [Candidatus Anoxychlamydiales bacterium]
MTKEKIRISKLLSLKGICSRREAEYYIEKRLIEIDGTIIDKQGVKVFPDCNIKLLSKALNAQKEKVTIILNKPIGYVSTQAEKGYKDAKELILKKNQSKFDDMKFLSSMLKRLSVVGRLDIDSKGLLIFTQDGTIAKKLIGPNSNMEKEYLVYFEGILTKEKIDKLTLGLNLDGNSLKKAIVKQQNKNCLNIILKEGKKRQIRRMLELVDLKVTNLKRVRVGNIKLSNLKEGTFRILKKEDFF